MIARTLRLAAALLPLTLPGCAVWSFMLGSPRIHDLRFESIEVTDFRDHPEFWSASDRLPSQPMPTLLVRFSTAHDLARVYANGGHTILAAVSLCTDARFDGDRLLTGSRSVRTAAGDVMTAGLDPPPLPRRADGRIVYSFFPDIVSQAGKYRTGDIPDPEYVSRDLRHDPADLCFRLRGGTMAFTSYTSSTATIPAEALRAAFARDTPPAIPPAAPGTTP
ncbi:Hypothetical protein RMHFA_01338 [Roseomonas mucosa]|uniref:Uncharacterized protein n=1 Tax=Roseomonas mucosa TaxID=207340 RepID=A0A1S8CZJ2_9PROT|nr:MULTISPECIES: hypothetical protein [Roseomonas]MDT8263701.1 hypothetical protein [Roseomonas sp. DSM 102946]ATR20739.1 hypothetical protein CTJ15_10800 [Roseomonas sp. FDAARGOS_362]ONH81139.1 hypothetical protein APZ41_021505 [Roseomonas mucosa]UZO96997.1 Hypothetical protein RMHFA_01338 [Roseomonas mucosa]GAV33375.1 hypothetical protein ROTAS13_01030 [Roseomonas sp. TAS13]